MSPPVVYKAGMRRLVVAIVASLAMATAGRSAEPMAIVVVIDGLPAAKATPEHLPRLAARAAAANATWTTAHGVLPARTNPNHASILTGYWPDGHGIVGNRYWDAATRTRIPMEEPGLLESQTILDVVAERSGMVAKGFFGKAKLRRLFAVTSDAPARPPVIWDAGPGYVSDGGVLRAAGSAIDAKAPASLIVIGIADVDRTSHRVGPQRKAVDEAIEQADRLLDGFLGVLVDRGLWSRTVVIVTADHGFAPVAPDGVIELPAGTQDGIAWIDEGRVALGHVLDPGKSAAALVSLRGRRGITGVRTDLAAIGLGHPRAGDLMLMAAPGFAFTLDAAAYRMRGDHGGEEERAVPFIVVGGHPALRRLPADVHPELPDVAPTLAEILGVPDPRTRRSGDHRHGRRLPLWSPPPAS
jgi:predicted AlkP superfamily pyrophosphatase or phosphodiesterase